MPKLYLNDFYKNLKAKIPCKNRGLIDANGGPDGFRTQCLLLSHFLLITYVYALYLLGFK